MKTTLRERRLNLSVGILVTAIFSAAAYAATFNLFQPATGILKGNANTYVTTAAVSSDVRGLWSGTCDASTFLRGDGSCAVPAGTGVTSVALTMPTGFSVGGSPVTSAGTLAVTTTLNGVLKGNGSGFSASNVNLTSEVTGTLPVSNGGIGVATLTGVAKGNGTSAFTAAANTDITGLFTGTCNSSTFLRGDGSCQSPTVAAAGSNTQVQFNNSGSFAGAASLTYDSGTGATTHAGEAIFTAANARTISSTNPLDRFNDTNASSGNQAWRWNVDSGTMSLQFCADSFSSCPTTPFSISRSGTAVNTVAVTGGLTVGGVDVATTSSGAGTATVGGALSTTVGIRYLRYSNPGNRTMHCIFLDATSGTASSTNPIAITLNSTFIPSPLSGTGNVQVIRVAQGGSNFVGIASVTLNTLNITVNISSDNFTNGQSIGYNAFTYCYVIA